MTRQVSRCDSRQVTPGQADEQPQQQHQSCRSAMHSRSLPTLNLSAGNEISCGVATETPYISTLGSDTDIVFETLSSASHCHSSATSLTSHHRRTVTSTSLHSRTHDLINVLNVPTRRINAPLPSGGHTYAEGHGRLDQGTASRALGAVQCCRHCTLNDQTLPSVKLVRLTVTYGVAPLWSGCQ